MEPAKKKPSSEPKKGGGGGLCAMGLWSDAKGEFPNGLEQHNSLTEQLTAVGLGRKKVFDTAEKRPIKSHSGLLASYQEGPWSSPIPDFPHNGLARAYPDEHGVRVTPALSPFYQDRARFFTGGEQWCVSVVPSAGLDIKSAGWLEQDAGLLVEPIGGGIAPFYR